MLITVSRVPPVAIQASPATFIPEFASKKRSFVGLATGAVGHVRNHGELFSLYRATAVAGDCGYEGLTEIVCF